MKSVTKGFVLFLVAVFIAGIAFCLHPSTSYEGMNNMLQEETLEQVHGNSCPDLLIRSNQGLELYNTKQPKGPDNPLIFPDLDKYTAYLQEQRAKNVRCPVLFLQEENNAQGKTVYRMRPGPNNLNAGAPIAPVEVTDASRDRKPYNKGNFAGFDPYGQHIGEYTELDQIHDSTQKAKVSDNPMDSNWGGVLFSQQSVDSGKYADREVGKPSMTPKVLEIYK
jgi:hypothetical protein